MSASSSLELSKPVVLVGMMGCGKSTIGRRLAKRLQLEFHDSDHEIEAQEGMSISEMFNTHGEAYFRACEKNYIASQLQKEPHILATGGGAFINPEVRELIQTHGVSVWLRSSLDVLLERVSRRNNRPLLEQGDKRTILADLIEKRYPIYEEAILTIDSEATHHSQTVDAIIQALTAYTWKQ